LGSGQLEVHGRANDGRLEVEVLEWAGEGVVEYAANKKRSAQGFEA